MGLEKGLEVNCVQALRNSPFVRVRMAEEEISMLLDTGADISLIDENHLSEQQRSRIVSSTRGNPRAASGNEVAIRGVLRSTVWLGRLVIKDHPFYVVKNLVVPLIGGADFLSRLGKQTWDWSNSKLCLQGQTLKLETLYRSARTLNRSPRAGRVCQVMVINTTCINPGEEALIPCRVSGRLTNSECILEPRPYWQGDSPIRAMCCLLQPIDSLVSVRLVNAGDNVEEVSSGHVVGVACSEFEVSLGKDRKTKDTRKVTGYQLDSDLEPCKQREVVQLINEYSDVFWQEGDQLPMANMPIQHEIHLKDNATPQWSRPRRLVPDTRVEVREEVQYLLRQGLIRESTSPWAAPIVAARRKNGKLRLAMDYRRLNALTHPQHHPLPLIDDLVDQLTDAKFFSSVDLKSGYHQMPLRKEDAAKSAFVTPDGQYEWTGRGTPFGLSGAPATFQRLMSAILGELNWSAALCYLDDVLVWGRTWREHSERLREVLNKLRNAGVLLSPTKCCFGVREVEFLGHVIGNGTMRISEARTRALMETPKPTTVTLLRKAMGAFSYVQRWIPGMATIAKPLYAMMKGPRNAPLRWSEEASGAFEKLRSQVASAPILQLPDMKKPFVLVTDASDVGTGAMLAQHHDGKQLAPVAFFHHTLSQAERNYPVTDRELLAVILAIKKFRIYLSSQPFDLITDHAALKWLNSLSMDEIHGRRARWLDYLQQFQIRPIHRPGTSPELSMADYLSRVGHHGFPLAMQCLSLQVVDGKRDGIHQLTTLFTIEELRAAQRSCPAVGPVIQELQSSRSDGTICKESECILRRRARLCLGSDGVLRYKESKGRSTQSQPMGRRQILVVVLPRSLRRKFLELVHNAPLSGHMGRNRTVERIRDIVWWPYMSEDVATYVRGCDACQRHKRPKHPDRAQLEETDIPSAPLARIQIDFVGPFQPSVPDQFRYVLAIQDVLTRYSLLVPAIDCTADTAARIILERWLTVFDIPEVIQSDQGSHFTGDVFSKLCAAIGIRQALSSPNHAQSNGQVERQNQLIDNVRCVCDADIAAWPDAVVSVQYAHNTSPNATTGYSPYQLLFHQHPNRPERFAVPQLNGVRLSRKIERMDRVFTKVKRRIRAAQEVRRRQSGGKANCGYGIGDLVRFKLQPGQRTFGKKLHAFKSDLYIVVKRRKNSYVIKPVGAKEPCKTLQRHYNELEAAPQQILSWEENNDDSESENESAINPDTTADPVDLDHSASRSRRGTRVRRGTTFLQADPSRKRYSSDPADAASELSSSEDVDSDGSD